MTNTNSNYTIQIAEPLASHWSDWLGGLHVCKTAVGTRPDQCALIGVLNHIHALGLTLLIMRKETTQ